MPPKEKKSQPLWKEWDYEAQKKGIRNTVYSVNGNTYTGEWLDNKKHGELQYIGTILTAFPSPHLMCIVIPLLSLSLFTFL